MPSFAATDRIAADSCGWSCRDSITIRTARSRSSVGHFEGRAVGGHEKLPGDGHEIARWRT